MKDLIYLIPTWYNSTHAINAANSVRRFYPDIPVFFVADEYDDASKNDWYKLAKATEEMETSFDADTSKLVAYPNSVLLLRKHTGWETEGHGQAITDAMKFIYSKWVLLTGADVRVIKEGFLEEMLNDTNNKCCGIGDDWSREAAIANVGKWLCLFRGDLYHKYDLNFSGDLSKRLDAGQMMFGSMVEKGHKIKYMDVNGFIAHLTNIKNESWEKYYEIE